MDDPSRLNVAEVENLRSRCQLRGPGMTAREFGVPELDLLRAMIGLQAAHVVAIVRPKLAPILSSSGSAR
jgi:hypothetical protein